MELIHCDSSKKIKLDSKEIILGRKSDKLSKIISRNQLSIRSFTDSVLLKNLGKNPVQIGKSEVISLEEVRVSKNCDIFLPGGVKYKLTGFKTMSSTLDFNDLQVFDGLRNELMKIDELNGWREMDGGKMILYSNEIHEEEVKVAAFDMDGTLIKTKSGKVFPVNEHDWLFYSDNVVSKLQNLHNNGFKIVIFSNQGGIALGSTNKNSIKSKIEKIISKVGVPIQAFLATSYDFYRKPCPGMWFSYVAINKSIVNYDESFYVGDAAGRPQNWCKGRKKDHSMADRLFARNTKLKFYTPEEFFEGQKPVKFKEPIFSPIDIPTKQHPNYNIPSLNLEVILMVGSPGSGKSHFVQNHLLAKGYVSISRDVLNTWQNCVRAMEKYLELKKNIVIDNTNPNTQSREKFILVAKSYNTQVRCFMMESSIELCKHNNKFRQLTDKEHTLVTDIIINDYWKKYEEPQITEGFDEIVKVPFVPNFTNVKDQHLFNMYLTEK